jgi:ATP synthase subunit 6
MWTPLEQFQIISLVSLKMFNLDLSITNLLIVFLLLLFFFIATLQTISKYFTHLKGYFFFIVPNTWQFFIEIIYATVLKLLFDNLNQHGEIYFPFISMVFLFILFCNLIGLVPYSFTVTSHLIVTFSMSFSIFIGINIIGFKHYKQKLLSLFLPANTSFLLALILVPIEFISYIAKPISLGVRLFINLMAGHTLLKVIVGFSWSILLIEDTLSIIQIVPLIILIILMGLELAVAVIQAYVFTILTCIYLNDSINLH